jgi:hypothetical protein
VQAIEGEDANIHIAETFLTFSEDSISDKVHALGVRGKCEALLPRHSSCICGRVMTRKRVTKLKRRKISG